MKPIRKPTTLDLLLLMLTGMTWAAAFIAIKIAVPETGPLWLAAIRVGVGTLVLLPYVLWRGIVLPHDRRSWTLIIAMALLNVVIPFFLISWAELTIDAGVTSILMGTGPFAALVGSHFFTSDDRINAAKLTAVLLGFSGVIVIIGADALTGIGEGDVLAQLAAVGGSLCYVAAGLLIRRIEMPPVRLAFLALSIGTAVLVTVALAVDGPVQTIPSNEALGALLFLGVFPTGLAYILRFHLIRTVGYSTFAYSVNLIPVFGVMLGVIILDEPLRPQVLIALALIVAGLFIARAGSTGQAATKSATKSTL
ncbi:DMT family transporter [Oricola cellulosilytica]|uniref:DMT family transporter n=1 Tax=Oricola cellulosilytica TaxID=1429082 RepID=A0A4R0P887_9HYPH|nr:DMT family transporter [Oricola cellulosilytica]TCD13239.1 DMT family transporter [Oricola cellulosilytica]